MRFNDLHALEDEIALNGLSRITQQSFDIPVSGDASLRMQGIVCSREDGQATYFYQSEYTKERIVLHFTAGNLKGDLLTLTDEKHVSVAFVIARNGTIYQLFDPAYWSYHLGPDAVGGNTTQSRKTIGIELSNYGPLIRNGNNLETVYSTSQKRDLYCTLDDVREYVHLEIPYRGNAYFATFTDLQYDSLIVLLRHLTHQFEIPKAFLPLDNRFDAVQSVLTHKGIVSHVNYRTSGKWDIGPAFDWERVIKGVQAETFKPLTAFGHMLRRKNEEIQSVENSISGLQAKLSALREELRVLEETGDAQPREMVLRSGLFTTEDVNAVSRLAKAVDGDTSERDIEPGYNPLLEEEENGKQKTRVTESSLRQLLLSDSTPQELLDTYFMTVFDGPFAGYLELREDVEVIPDVSGVEAEKGAIMNMVVAIANNLSRRSRYRKYRDRIRQFPDAPRLLSEGDSWFQHPHPKVLDIIDQLSAYYPIHCIGAAGDTLRNMFYEGEYMQALLDEKPAIFLLSGGGNDILGDQFRHFLVDTFDEDDPGTRPERFLRENFRKELEAIGDIYQNVFQKLANQPVEVLIHGYDYVIPWNSRNKGWLGRYMLEKNINAEEDRNAIIRWMLDAFNAMLKERAAAFSKVHYLDLRNTVRSDQWYDEIHPSNDGYQDVALKYHTVIRKILNK